MSRIVPFLALTIFLVITLLAIFSVNQNPHSVSAKSLSSEPKPTYNPTDYGPAQNTPHFVKSSPSHKSTISKLPDYIEVDFDAPLRTGSNLTIENGDDQYVDGDTLISADKMSIKRKLDHSAPDGRYFIAYTACFNDQGDCSEGYFKFEIDRSSK